MTDQPTYKWLSETGDTFRRTIAQALSTKHPLTIAEPVLAKLVEARDAIFEAQRLIESENFTAWQQHRGNREVERECQLSIFRAAMNTLAGRNPICGRSDCIVDGPHSHR